MALVKCKECGKEISDKAKTCPNCGCPIEDEFAKTETTKDIQTEPKKNEKKKREKCKGKERKEKKQRVW